MEIYSITIIGKSSGNRILDGSYAGKQTAICEQGIFGRTRLNVGHIPTKTFGYVDEVANSIQNSAQYGIDAHIDRVH